MKNPANLGSALRKLALALPEVEEGIACKGTALESTTFKIAGKAFLFLGPKDCRLKLDDSLPEAAERATKEPTLCEVGAKGWVKLALEQRLAQGTLKRWVGESYQLFAPKA